MSHPDPISSIRAGFSMRAIALPAFGPSLLFGLGEGAVMPVIALVARDMGASVSMAALIVGLVSLGSLVCNIPGSLFTARFGERSAMVAAGMWSALGMVLCVLTRQLWLFAAGCVMVGMSQAIYSLARQSYLAEAVPLVYRARALSTLGGVSRIGGFFGAFVGAWAMHRWGLHGAFGVGMVGVLCAAGLGATVPDLVAPALPTDAAAAQAQASLASTLREHWHVMVTLGMGVLLVTAVRASRQVVIPLWADHLEMAPALASLIYGIAGGVDMLVFYPAGRLMDLKGRRWVAVPSMMIMGTAMLLMPLTTGLTTLLLVAVALGFGNGIGSGMIMTLGTDHAPRHGRAHFMGIWRLAVDVGSSIGPALLSFMAGSLSLASGIASIGVLAYAAAAVLARWIPTATAARTARPR